MSAGVVAAHYVATTPTVAGSTLTIPAGKVASTLTDFVTRVDLSLFSTTWWAAVSSDGGNIRVRSGGSDIPFDLVWVNTTTRTGLLFFKSTLTTSANVFTVETVAGATAVAAGAANGRYACWSDYAAVLDYKTNRANGNAPVEVASVPLTTDGWMQFMTSSGQTARGMYIAGVAAPATWTIGISAYSTDTTASNKTVWTYTAEGSTADAARETLSDDNGDTRGLWNSTDGWRYFGAVNRNVSERRVVVHEGTTSDKIYLNGALVLTDTGVAARPTGTTADFVIGTKYRGYASTDGGWQGNLRFAYVRANALSADWIAAEAVSWETPASFYSIT